VTEERVNFARWRHVDEWMDGSGEIRWMDDSKLPSQILSTPIVSTPATDYIQTEAERLARFIEALDAMDGATEPMESDSGMNVKPIDSDKDVTSGLHARSKRLEHSVSDTDSFRATRNTERMESIRRGVEQSKAGEVTRYPAGHFRQAYIDTYGVAPEDDEDDPELPSQILSTPIVPTPNTVEQRNVTKLDVGTSFVTITISTLGQRDVTQSHLVPTSVTITISREAAKKVADWPDDERYPFSAELGKAARAALEEER